MASLNIGEHLFISLKRYFQCLCHVWTESNLDGKISFPFAFEYVNLFVVNPLVASGVWILTRLNFACFADRPRIPHVVDDIITGDDWVQCMTKAYPIRNPKVSQIMRDENGQLRSLSGRQIFHRESLYGTYNIGCTASGIYHDVAYMFYSINPINYTGISLFLECSCFFTKLNW